MGRCGAGAGAGARAWTYQFTVEPGGGGLWRVPVVAGGAHDYGRAGNLLVCDGTGYYQVLNRREVHRLELPHSGARPRRYKNPKKGLGFGFAGPRV